MTDYSDKGFIDTYQEILNDVKTLSSNWDPSVSDESDPGVAILKAFALFIDKLNYKINYRNSQNSVETVTDPIEGKNLFARLGYQVKEKRSANGQLKIKNLGSEDLVIPMFTEFSDPSNSITYTSIRKEVTIKPGYTNLVEVQEGVASLYSYEGVNIFTNRDLTNNYKLPLIGYDNLSENGVIVTSVEEGEENSAPIYSNWLNIKDNFFNSVQTANTFSLGREVSGEYYLQFYPDKLANKENLSEFRVKIWIISSFGSAGNLGSNKISKISSPIEIGNPDKVKISHLEFTNGSEGENLVSAKNNYYDTFGINNTLISERDYQVSIEKQIGPNLVPITSKVIVKGVHSPHNLVEVLTTLENGSKTILTSALVEDLTTQVMVSALKYSSDYYESFSYLYTKEAQDLIRKGLYNKRVVSNDVILNRPESFIENPTDYFIFDKVLPEGVVFIKPGYSIDEVRKTLFTTLKDSFNSRNLSVGKMVSEEDLSRTIKEKVPGVTGASFYYKKRELTLAANETDKIQISNMAGPFGEEVTTQEKYDSCLEILKADIISRSVLNGKINLFEKDNIQVLPIGYSNFSEDPVTGNPVDNNIVFLPVPGKKIKNLTGTFKFGYDSDYVLDDKKIIQFYKKAYDEDVTYGFGIEYKLLSDDGEIYLGTEVTINSTSNLLPDSLIGEGSKIKGENLDLDKLKEGSVITDSPDSEGRYTFRIDYRVKSGITLTYGDYLSNRTYVKEESVINTKTFYKLTLVPDKVYNLTELKAKLIIKSGEDENSTISYGWGTNNPNISIKIKGTGNLVSKGIFGQEVEYRNLTTTLNINILKVSKYDVKDNFVYGISFSEQEIGKKPGFIFDKVNDNNGVSKFSYLLEEGEFLVYSDGVSGDYISLGSGTLLEYENKDGDLPDSFILSNRIDLNSDFSEALELIPSGLSFYNTDIQTFGKDTEVRVGNGFKFSENFTLVDPNIDFFIDGSNRAGELELYHRELLKIRTDSEGIFNFTLNEYLKVTLIDSNGVEEDILIGEGVPDNKYRFIQALLSFSKPVYLISPKLDLTDLDLGLAIYRLPSGLSKEVSCGYSKEGFNFKIKLEEDVDKKPKMVSVPLRCEAYLLEIEVYQEDESGKVIPDTFEGEVDLYITLNDYSKTDDYLKPPRGECQHGRIINLNSEKITTDNFNYIVLPSNKKVQLLLFPSVGKSTITAPYLTLLFTGCKKGTTFKLIKSRKISGINKNLSLDKATFKVLSTPPQTGDTPFFILDQDSESYAILKEVWLKLFKYSNGLYKDKKDKIDFDFFYEPASPLENPLDPVKFYQSEHPYNRNILTLIDFKELEKQENTNLIRIIQNLGGGN